MEKTECCRRDSYSPPTENETAVTSSDGAVYLRRPSSSPRPDSREKVRRSLGRGHSKERWIPSVASSGSEESGFHQRLLPGSDIA